MDVSCRILDSFLLLLSQSSEGFLVCGVGGEGVFWVWWGFFKIRDTSTVYSIHGARAHTRVYTLDEVLCSFPNMSNTLFSI